MEATKLYMTTSDIGLNISITGASGTGDVVALYSCFLTSLRLVSNRNFIEETFKRGDSDRLKVV